MSNPPLVSIGLPVYNGEPFLKEALDSLVAQDYPNFELIISDNASTDGTGQICLDYAARDSRIKYYGNSENVGALANFNRVFTLARGEYFAWAAHDDIWEPAYFSTLARLLQDHPDAVLAFSAFSGIDERGQEVGKYPRIFDLPSDGLFQRLSNYIEQDECLGKANPVFGLMSRAVLTRIGGLKLWGNCVLGSDMLLVFWLLTQGNLVLAEETLFHKRLVEARGAEQAPFATIPGQRRYFAGYLLIISGLASLNPLEKIRLRMTVLRRFSRFCRRYIRDTYVPSFRQKASARRKQLVWDSYGWLDGKPLLHRSLRTLKRNVSNSAPQPGVKK